MFSCQSLVFVLLHILNGKMWVLLTMLQLCGNRSATPFFRSIKYRYSWNEAIKQAKCKLQFSVTDQRNKTKAWRTHCTFHFSDLDVLITPQLTSYKIEHGRAAVILLGAGWHVQGANFHSVKSCNYASAAGCLRGANNLPFQATVPTFYELFSWFRG